MHLDCFCAVATGIEVSLASLCLMKIKTYLETIYVESSETWSIYMNLCLECILLLLYDLTLFVKPVVVIFLQSNEHGNKLKDTIIENDVCKMAIDYILKNSPVVKTLLA